MKPFINNTEFGSIKIDGKIYENDVVIRLDGEIIKRKKKLSKEKYGTSHKISLEEAKHIYDKGAEKVFVGTGQYGVLKLSKEAIEYFKKKKCKIELLSTPEAIQKWNESSGATIAIFHVTC